MSLYYLTPGPWGHLIKDTHVCSVHIINFSHSLTQVEQVDMEAPLVGDRPRGNSNPHVMHLVSPHITLQ